MTKPIKFDLVDLRLYTNIVEAGSLSKAAVKFPLALSATSARLKALEERLGLQLLIRSAQGVTPSNAGLLFYDHALRMLQTAREAQSGMDALSGKTRQLLKVFSNTTGLSTLLPEQLANFLLSNPNFDLCFEQHASRDCLKAVESDRADIAIVDGGYDKKDLLSFLYQHIRLVVIANKDHPIAKQKNCSFAEWLSQPLIGFDQSSSLQQFLERMAILQHLPAKFRVTAPTFAAVAKLVSMNVGVAILPEQAALTYLGELPLSIIELREPWAVRELNICLKSENNNNLPVLRLARYLAGIE